MKEPYYLVDFNVALANFDILINDVLAFSYESGGSIFSNYPINHFILHSGPQQLKLRFRPLKGQILHPDADATIKIQYLDAATMDQSQLTTIYEYKMKKANDEKLPIIESIAEFNAEVPYNLKGWTDAIAVKNDSQSVVNQVHKYYHRIYDLFKNEDIVSLDLLLKRRYEETDASMYLIEDNLAALKNIFKMLEAEEYVLQEFPMTPLVEFYAGNRVINLKRENHSPIISYLKKAENEEFGFPFYIYVPKNANSFEIIR